MANALYPKFKENLLKGNIDFDTGTVKAYLVDLADYTYSASHALLADLPVAARVSVSNVDGVTVTNNVVDSNNVVLTAVSGDQAEAVVLTISMGGTEYLVAYWDTGVVGLPVTPNGGDININVNELGLFSL